MSSRAKRLRLFFPFLFILTAAEACSPPFISSPLNSRKQSFQRKENRTRMEVEEFKKGLEETGRSGLVLDIDETLSATNVYWMSTLSSLFGNPENLSPQEIAKKYHLAQNVPYWQTKEALEWMQSKRDCSTTQELLPVIEGALQGVTRMMEIGIPIVGYLTVRPSSTNGGTEKWLNKHGFPDLPVVAKPTDVPFQEGNQWKGKALEALHPHVLGIVDDNPSVLKNTGPSFPGVFFLFSHEEVPSSTGDAGGKREATVVACPSWTDVTEAANTWWASFKQKQEAGPSAGG
uniref:FCP1 homology domain-containing protein n=1 Tax=Chromera velia CCMP2878 TaxID=1169474 RepID=A0A0G4HX66_9ALVE|eukprot:Cvel_9195.t1-p1 / transcript=Cvel_9195.t1 / gene=Cvel_9195 / organism=Chromera_velia_CCMP2878 / gene_product=hypothetical protein / transcript_product=hypothetical protein / location=Cvel_scaffold524:16543-17406(+) / protein_length=288 / sequence_SO=supercontig / SO=protein_coding / is_pseudo=false